MAKCIYWVSPKPLLLCQSVHGCVLHCVCILKASRISSWQAALHSAGEGCRNRCGCQRIFNATWLNLERFEVWTTHPTVCNLKRHNLPGSSKE